MNAAKLEKMQAESRKRHQSAFFNMCVNMHLLVPKEEPKRYADLMDSKLSLPCASNKNEVMKENNWLQTTDKPYVDEKKIFRSPGIIPDPVKQKEERPPATYSNSRSPYGIYDELKEEWNKKTG